MPPKKKQKSKAKAAEPQFVHLRVHGSYSLAEGAIKITELVGLCRKHNMPAVALTDSGNLFGSLEFAVAAAKEGVQPIIGCVVNVVVSGQSSVVSEQEAPSGQMVLLARDEEGYRNLLKLVSHSFLNGKDSHNPTVTLDKLQQHSAGLIALSGGPEGIIGKYLQNDHIREAEEVAEQLKQIFPDRFYIELMRHNLDSEKHIEKPLIDIAYKYDLPLVATNDVFFSERDMHMAQDALICIADGSYVGEEKRRRYTPEHYFKSAEEMAELFADIPEAIENTLVIAQRCAIMPEPQKPMLPDFPTEGGRSQEEELRAVARTGLCGRLGEDSYETLQQKQPQYCERLEYELDVIAQMGFPGYFLIVSDFIRWSKRNSIPVGPGRGSGAGSLVAWVLQITDLDPLRFGLLFERFLNPERVSMPDFDIDFCQYRRDEVIHYVQERYGADKVAQIITFGKLQARAVLRDVGRVLQMSYGQVDRICKMVPWNPIDPVTLEKAIDMDPQLKKEAKQDEQVAQLLDIGLKLEGLHRHASTHAAGVVIGSKPLTEIVPLYSDHRSDIPTTQYSMKYAEMAGLVKFDFLGLKTLTVIDRACQLIREQGGEIDIEDSAYDDEATFKMLSGGNATGVFQMESAGMRDALRKLKPDSIEDIIALISLYRPGPMENIPTYIARKHGREKPEYPHPMLEECLKETFGVIIYQEQVMEIAKILAGYSLGGADLLRRAMGKKIKAEMDAQRDMFVEGAVKNGVSKTQASSIFDLVAKFAGYGFNKSHAAAYAVIGYQTAYLKANHPVEFLTAFMNIDIGDTDKLNILREEASKSGIAILPPDINKSGAYFTIEHSEDGKAIRYGLGALKGVGIDAMSEMEEERRKNSIFRDIFDFAARCNNKVINKRQLESLAKCGAFDCLNKNRHQLFESATILTRYSAAAAEERASNQINLFGDAGSSDITHPKLPDIEDWASEERMMREFDAVGFYLTSHPLDIYKQDLQRIGVICSNEFAEKIPDKGGNIKVAGVVVKVTHREREGRRFAYLNISDHMGSIEISIFNDELISESRDLLEGTRPLLVEVDARKDEGGVRLQAESIVLLDDYLEGHKRNVRIEITDKQAVYDIKNILDNNGNNKSKDGDEDSGKNTSRGAGVRTAIYLIVTTNNNIRLELLLPETYTLPRNIEFSGLPGVGEVRS